MITLTFETGQREQMLDITAQIQNSLSRFEAQSGALHLYCPHTTCGLTINEGADPDVCKDIMRFFNEIAPYQHGWAHREGNSSAHIRASLLGASLLLPVADKTLCLGRWQTVYLYEGDGPRSRKLYAQMLAVV